MIIFERHTTNDKEVRELLPSPQCMHTVNHVSLRLLNTAIDT